MQHYNSDRISAAQRRTSQVLCELNGRLELNKTLYNAVYPPCLIWECPLATCGDGGNMKQRPRILGLIQFRERARIFVDLTKLLQTNMGDIRYTCVYCCPGPGLCGAWPELCVRVPCVYCTFLCKTQFVKWILTAQKPGPDIAANLVENAGIIHTMSQHTGQWLAWSHCVTSEPSCHGVITACSGMRWWLGLTHCWRSWKELCNLTPAGNNIQITGAGVHSAHLCVCIYHISRHVQAWPGESGGGKAK